MITEYFFLPMWKCYFVVSLWSRSTNSSLQQHSDWACADGAWRCFFLFVCRRSQRYQKLNSSCLFLSFSAVCPVAGCELLFSTVIFVKRWQTFLLRFVIWSTRLVSGKWCCCGIMAASFPSWRQQTSHTNIFGSTFFCLWWKKVVSSEFCFHSLNCPIDIQRMKSCWDTDRKWVGRT